MTNEGIFEILIGTYEEFVLGYQLIKTEDEEHKYSLHQTFVTHSHTASVRSLASTPKLAASSGADETVILYDMVKRKQSGALMQQEGTITCLKFTPDGSHLISCSDDGSIAIFRVGSWQLEKLFKNAHKGTAVNHIAVHPSEKLAMSVGRDKTLRTWNLIKGRSAYITNLSSFGVSFENLDLVVWSPQGLLYALPIQTKALIFSVEKGGILHTLESTCKVHSVCFLNETTACIGNEESDIVAYDISMTSTGSQLWSFKATSSRIKALTSYENHLIVITSAGDLVVWNFNEEDLSEEPIRVAATNDACRFTCLTIRPPIVSEPTPVDNTANSTQNKKKKKKKSLNNNLSEISNNTPTNQTKISEQYTPFLNIKTIDEDDDIEIIDVSLSGDTKNSNTGDVEIVNVSIGGDEKRKKKNKDMKKGGKKSEKLASESKGKKMDEIDEDGSDNEERLVKSTTTKKKNLKRKSEVRKIDENLESEEEKKEEEDEEKSVKLSKKKKLLKKKKSSMKNSVENKGESKINAGSKLEGKRSKNSGSKDFESKMVGKVSKNSVVNGSKSDEVKSKKMKKKNVNDGEEEFVRFTTGFGGKKKKTLDQEKMLAKKKKRQGTFG